MPRLTRASASAAAAAGTNVQDETIPEPTVTQCDEPGCGFTTANGRAGARGLSQHKKHRHIGRLCFWKKGEKGVCGFAAATDAEFVEHFSTVHLAREVPADGRAPRTFACRWLGFPGWVNKDDPAAPVEGTQGACGKTFSTEQSAQRHAREHQWALWLEHANDGRQLP